jgi:hypothetical protein
VEAVVEPLAGGEATHQDPGFVELLDAHPVLVEDAEDHAADGDECCGQAGDDDHGGWSADKQQHGDSRRAECQR